MSTLIKLRRDTAANWAAEDPVLQLGEPGYDTTNNELRIGDGTSPWSELTPIAGGGGGGGLPLSNGSSNFNIATSGGNATITVDGTNTWTFDTTGVFTPADDIRVGATGGRYIQDCIDGTTSMRWYNIDSEGESQLVRAYTGDALTENDIERGKISINWTSNTDSGVTVTAFSTDVGNAQTESVWAFQGDGNFVAPGNIIVANNVVGTSLQTNLRDFNWSESISNIATGNTTTVTLANNVFGDPWTGQVTITGVTGATQANDTWWYEATESNEFQLYTDSTLSTPVNSSGWGAYTGGGFAVTLDYSNIVINGQNVTIRSDHGDYNNKIWRFDRTGQTIFPYMDVARGDNPSGTITGYAMIMGDGTAEAIISTPDGNINGSYSSQRLVINPGKGGDGTSGEGGDIYLWAGRGGDSGGSGGDIKIRGGQGGTDNGQGGYIRMEGGDGDSSGGAPGFIEITGGSGGVGQNGGYVRIQGGQGQNYGGDANITGGVGQNAPGGAVNITGGVSGNGLAEYGNVNITSGSSSWTFDNTGNLTLPNGTPSINYANGSPFSGAPVNTGNLAFDQSTITSDQSNAYINFNAFDAGDIDVGTNDANNVVIRTDASTANNAWTFDANGVLTLPGSGVIDNPLNSSLDPLNPNVSTMVLTPDSGYSFQALVLDPTAPGHIHLRAPSGTGNIDQPTANIFLGGEQSSFEVSASYGDAPNVFVHSGGATWTFDTTGNLEIPANGYIETPLGSNGNINIHPDGNGIVTISGNSTGALLRVVGDEVNSFNRIEVDTFGNIGTLGGAFTGIFSRGTPTAPAAVQNQDRLAVFTGKGYDGTATSLPAAQITVDAVGNWSPSNHGTHISFYTTPQGSTSQQEVVRIYGIGDLHQIIGNIVVEDGWIKTNAYTVSSLPLAANAGIGARSFVSDADTRAFGNIVVGGAGNAMPVWSDGTNWYIG